MSRSRASRRRNNRAGKTLVVMAILLPVLLGMVGLVIDGGILMVSRRHARNAADAGAMAAAADLVRNRSSATAAATATTFVQQYNELPTAEVVVNAPPVSGSYSGQTGFVEVIVRQPMTTSFIQVLGVDPQQILVGRAVAGFEAVPAKARILALNPSARPGIGVSGGGSLTVNGAVAINSEGGGVDEDGRPVNGNIGTAASVGNNSTFRATSIRTVGGVNNPANFRPYDTNLTTSPLAASSPSQPDPFINLPPPTTANGANATERPAVNVSGTQSVTLYPGVYPSMSITGGSTIFSPGIYIIRGGSLKITEQNVIAKGVMFYITGNDYNVNTGLPDAADLENAPPAPGGATLGSVTLNAGLTFSGYDNPSSPFHGMLFYQRRLNTQTFNIQGTSAAGNLAGTIYAKWAHMKIAGQGTYNAQFVVGSLETTGSGTVSIASGESFAARSNQVFLAE